MEVKAVWQEGMRFTGAAESGFSLPMEAEAAGDGERAGFLPMELIAAGMAGCTAMDVISILQKKRQEVTAFEVQVHAERASEHPTVFTQAVIEYFVTGRNIEEAALVRAIELSSTRYCPAQAMLGKVFPIVLKYHIYEAAGGQPGLVVSGEFSQPVARGDG